MPPVTGDLPADPPLDRFLAAPLDQSVDQSVDPPLDPPLDYANLTGRPDGRFLTALGRALPGVARVQAQVRPYARCWHEANCAVLAGSGRRWIVLGDSMSLGIGASAFDAGWVNQAAADLAGRGHPLKIVNLSASGATVADVIAQQLPAWAALPDEPHAPAEIVTVLVGSNDLLNRTHRARLPERFDQLLAALPPTAVVSTLPQPRRAARAANEVIERYRRKAAVLVVDMRRAGPSSWRGKLAADHFHPNDRGYRAIADAFTPQLVRALGSADTASSHTGGTG
ncbi:MAG: SGNH/GDSL hydrolase family protein [Actinobacteria bacterium]|nr:SGNH/GDSL hydrolase family protein [Actinomycetota bacterium]